MKARVFLLAFAILLQIALAGPIRAHHSISAEFDTAHQVMVAGTITKVTWGNPHTFFFVDAKDPKSGLMVSWACELGSPNMLATLGWTHSTLKAGMMVSLAGTPARDGTRKVIARKLVVDGMPIVAWPSEQGKP
jgi:hypothetical protein